MILPMTGQQASTRKQERAGAQLYIQQHGDTVAGKTDIVLKVKDDTGAADVTKRLAEELIGNDHAKVLMGFGLTLLALATAPVATEAKVPEIVKCGRDRNDHREVALYRPHLVHASPRCSVPMAEWAVKNGIKKVVTIVADYGPGIDAETCSRKRSKRTAIPSRKKSVCLPRTRLRALPAAGKGRRARGGVFVFVPSVSV